MGFALEANAGKGVWQNTTAVYIYLMKNNVSLSRQTLDALANLSLPDPARISFVCSLLIPCTAHAHNVLHGVIFTKSTQI